ncbi:MAG: M36 family metallopeptidase [Archangium sp.]
MSLLLVGCSSADVTSSTAPAAPASLAAPSRVMLASPTPVALAAQAGGYATSVDARGVPRFLVATDVKVNPEKLAGGPEAAARFHVSRFLQAQGVEASVLDAARPVAVRDLGNSGRLVQLRQSIDGIELFPGDVKVLMGADLQLVAISGALRRPEVARSAFRLTAKEAVASAIGDRLGRLVPASTVQDLQRPHGGWEQLSVSTQGAYDLPDPAHVRRVYYAEGQALQAAYIVEFTTYLGAEDATETFRAIIAAADGTVLERSSLTAADAFSYRVWAETSGRPLDGPLADYTPHPTGTPDRSRPAAVPPVLITTEGYNRNLFGTVDPWLPAGATETLGNNVDAYGDTNLPDGFTNGDLRATATAAGVFDRTYDLALSPVSGTAVNPAQLMPAITNAFFVSNWLHDYWYNAGFDEVAGNNQFDNFGRGGVAGDRMNIEVQDRVFNAQRNNANMATPADGFNPRMQIFVWSGFSSRDLRTSLAPTTSIATGTAAFGPATFNVAGATLVLGIDATGAPNDGCTPLTNTVTGQIVVLDRGTCTFKTKALTAQNAGAVGLIIANNAATTTPPGLADDNTITTPITIGTLSVTQADGVTLKAGLGAGTVNVTVFTRLTEVESDGALDSLLMAHEYGHFLHHRLQDCSSFQCGGMSEGWGDFVAAHLMLRAGDNLNGTYSLSTYAAAGSSTDGAFFGLRRYPYTTDLTKSPLTFQYVADQGATLPAGIPNNVISTQLSEVHNAGEIWASTLFDAYVELQRQRATTDTFDVVKDRFAKDLVVALQLAPRDSTYTEMRDAILATLSARSATDRDIVAAAFARRGMGTCAVSPARYAVAPVTGLVESTTLSPSLSISTATLDDAISSCDQDGVLDGNERGALTVRVANTGPVAATATTITVASTTAGITVPDGGVVTVPSIAPFTTVSIPVTVALDDTVTAITTATFDITVDNANSCSTQLTSSLVTRLNTDQSLASSANDDVEADTTAWTVTGSPSDIWNREVFTAPNHAWHVVDFGAQSDTSLVSPELQVSATANFVVTFNHAYSFEYTSSVPTPPTPATAWDGAVIEVSENGGPWADVTTYGLTPGYGTPNITNTSGNPLAGRAAFVGRNTAYPATDAVSLDFGTQLAGKRVKLRFRVGTDQASGDFGWRLDDFTFTGITNTPFPRVVIDQGICQRPPVAVAGADRTVSRNQSVTLDASGSTDPDGDQLTFTWAQTAGPTVTLITTNTATTGFVAPARPMDTVLTFQVTVSDGTRTATDSVDITVTGNAAPVANAGMAFNVPSGAVGVLNGSASADADGDALTFTWSQTAGAMATIAGTSTATTTFTAPTVTADATLTFQLAVSDGTAMSTATVTVTVVAPPANQAPVAVATGSAMLQVGATGVLSASSSSDPDGDALTFTWMQTGGPTATLSGASSVVTTFVAPSVTADTDLTFEVTVSDGSLTDSASVTVTVKAPATPPANRAPVANAGSDQTVAAGVAVLLKGSESSDPESGKLTYSWKKTSGDAAVTLADATTVVTGFTAPDVNVDTTLVFELTVTDDAGATATDSVSVTVQATKKADGCSCTSGGAELGAIGMLALGLLRRRRRS